MWLTNVKIWNGCSTVAADAIEIEANKIRSVGYSADIRTNASRDMAGVYVIPGLIDAHIHLCLDPDIKNPHDQAKVSDSRLMAQIQERARRMLSAGITTARDLGGGKWLELKVRDLINSGELVGTRLICAGQPVTSVKGHCHFWGGEAKDLEAARRVMHRQIDKDVDLIKIMATGGTLTPGSTPAQAQFSAAEMAAMVNFAKARGYTVAAHCHGTQGIQNAAAAKVTTIEHCSWVGNSGWARGYDAQVTKTIVANGVWISPTISVGWQRYLGNSGFAGLVMDNMQKMRQAGVKLIASTDAGIPHVYHEDLPRALPIFAHFAQFSNEEALRAATSDCALAIGLGNNIGRIEPGLEADLVGYEDNPLENLSALSSPAWVMARGQFVGVEP